MAQAGGKRRKGKGDRPEWAGGSKGGVQNLIRKKLERMQLLGSQVPSPPQ